MSCMMLGSRIKCSACCKAPRTDWFCFMGLIFQTLNLGSDFDSCMEAGRGLKAPAAALWDRVWVCFTANWPSFLQPNMKMVSQIHKMVFGKAPFTTMFHFPLSCTLI